MMTVMLATYNGGKTLAKTLPSMANLARPEGGWKMVIIDNGSTDDTAEVIDRFKRDLPLTYCFEPKRGKNAALNTGLQFLEGDLAVFTDDDAIPREDWLLQLRAAATRHPDYAVFGGAIWPLWEVPPDPVILDALPLGPIYALTDHRWVEGPVSPLWVLGPNMAVRASIFESFRFDDGLGPDGSAEYVMGSETELTSRLSRHGHKCWHCANAVVQHIIRPHQLTREWVLRRAIRYGRGAYRAHRGHLGAPLPVLFGYPRYLVRRIGRAAIDLALAQMISDETVKLRLRWNFNLMIGRAREGRVLERKKRSSLGENRR